MPSLSHNPSFPFDIGKSEVVKYLIQQPDVQQWLFDKVRNKGWIVFDPANLKWHGKCAS